MKTRGFKFVTIAVLVLAIVSAVSFILMLLWNWLVPDLFSGPTITFLQAAGLLILSKILFSGIFHKKKHAMHQRWKHEFSRKLSMMSEEEREKLKLKMRSKWGPWGCRLPEEEGGNQEVKE